MDKSLGSAIRQTLLKSQVHNLPNDLDKPLDLSGSQCPHLENGDSDRDVGIKWDRGC